VIIDTIKNAMLYADVHPGVRKGLEFLQNIDPSLPDGRIDIDGDDVFALVQSYPTKPAAGKQFEAHRVYLDIQYMLDGRETIEVTPIDRLRSATDYDAEKDCSLYDGGDEHTPVLLLAGDFAVLFPEDGHKPGCLYQVSEPVRKIVVKVRL
jgi:biofilm protein TabA